MVARYEAVVCLWIDGLAGIAGVAASRGYPNEAGQPFGRAIVRVTHRAAGHATKSCNGSGTALPG